MSVCDVPIRTQTRAGICGRIKNNSVVLPFRMSEPHKCPSSTDTESATPSVPQRTCGAGCVCLFFWIAGSGYAYIGFHQLYYSTASLSWSSCEGTVVQAKCELHHGRQGSLYRPSIHYDYTIDDNQYTGYKYQYGEFGSSSQSWAKNIIAEHPVGSIIKVYYSPISPEDSVLIPGPHWGIWFDIGLGILLFVLGLSVFVAGKVNRAASNSA